MPSRCRSSATSNILSVEPSSITITSMAPRSARIVCSASPSMQGRNGFSSLWPARMTLSLKSVFSGGGARAQILTAMTMTVPIV
jgi:hypothetical protein